MLHQIKQAAKRLLGRTDNEGEGGVELPATYYNTMYAGSTEYRVKYWESRYYMLWCVICDRLKTGNLRRVLEVGCGPGQLASMLFDRGLVDKYMGFDFSVKAVEMAYETCPAGTFRTDDALTSTLYAQGWDAVICTEVLEHVNEDETIVGRFPIGARCICTVPNFPYESHVRHFSNADEVAARYSRFFKDFSVAGYRGNPPELEYFIFDGVRL